MAPKSGAGFGTLAVHAGSPHDVATGAVIAPVGFSLLLLNLNYQSNCFIFALCFGGWILHAYICCCDLTV